MGGGSAWLGHDGTSARYGRNFSDGFAFGARALGCAIHLRPPKSAPAAREIWGFPKKYAHPKLEIVKETLTGTLEYGGQLVAMGTMGYKHESMAGNGERTTATLTKTQVNLKLIPGLDGHVLYDYNKEG